MNKRKNHLITRAIELEFGDTKVRKRAKRR